MSACRAVCRFCTRRIALTATGYVWTHGRPECRGSRLLPLAYYEQQPRTYWPTWHNGRRVTTIPGPDTWNSKENAA